MSQPYMPLFVKEYLADTTHLSAEESGAYLHILMVMWCHGGTLPNRPGDLQRISRVAPQRWSRVWEKISPLFTIAGEGNITQKRLSKEWKHVSDMRATQQSNARARWNKNKDLPDAAAVPAECPHTYIKKEELEDSQREITTASVARTSRGAMLPKDWKPSDRDREWAVEKGFSDAFVTEQTEALRSWADANSNRGIARKANWSQAWQGWLRREWPRWSRENGHAPPKLSVFQKAVKDHIEEIEGRQHEERSSENRPGRRTIRGAGSERDHLPVYAEAAGLRCDVEPSNEGADWPTKAYREPDG